jgi:hypothetical protein
MKKTRSKDAVNLFNTIKVDLQLQINRLTKLKTALANSSSGVDPKMKSKLRI